MDIFSNIGRSLSGSVDKAILCVKKPVKATNGGKSSVSGSASNIDLQAQLAALNGTGVFSFADAAAKIAQSPTNKYHVLKVKYNPTTLAFDSRAGSFIQPGPGGPGTNTLSQVTMPAQTFLAFELLFDDVNNQDAFMFDKATNITAGSLVSDVSGIVKNIASDGYTVKNEVEGLIGLLTQSDTRQAVFFWSGMSFAGEVVSINATYTMFNSLGSPIRATVKITMRQGGEDSIDGDDSDYWNEAFDRLGTGKDPLGKVSNLLNFR